MGTRTTAVVLLLQLPLPVYAQGKLHITSGQVAVHCPLTIGGSFDARTRALTGEVGIVSDNAQPLDGDLSVDLQTLATGIGLRDQHLRNKYLEVERGPDYSHARLRNIRIERLSGRTPFQAVLMLHGESRAVSGTADIKPEGGGYRLVASFPVRVSEFGIPEPAYLGVGVKDEVLVRVNLDVEPAR